MAVVKAEEAPKPPLWLLQWHLPCQHTKSIALSFNPHVLQQAYMPPTISRSKEQEHALSKVNPVLEYLYCFLSMN